MKEEAYLELYRNKNDYIILDKFTPEDVEFCDLLCMRDGKIYLIHAKTGFGNVSRDHSLQALMSCEKIANNINTSIKGYFDKIYERCMENEHRAKFEIHFPTKESFYNAISNKNAIYIILLSGYESHG